MSEAKTFQDWKGFGGVKKGDVFVCVDDAGGAVYTRGVEYIAIKIPEHAVPVLIDDGHTEEHPSFCVETKSTFIKKEEKKSMTTGVFDGKQLFGKKYRVTPETSKLIQEAVFAAGGEWQGSRKEVSDAQDKFLWVSDNGTLTRSASKNHFERSRNPEGIITVGITDVTVVDKEAEAKKKQLEELDRKIKELQAILDKLKEEK